MTYQQYPLLITCIIALAMTCPADDGISLSKDLMPLFQRSCAACHQRKGGNPDAVKSGFLFETKEDVLAGSGKIIIPGKPEQSYLLYITTPPEDPNKNRKIMPPEGSKPPRLSEEEIQKISDWIQAGAKDN